MAGPGRAASSGTPWSASPRTSGLRRPLRKALRTRRLRRRRRPDRRAGAGDRLGRQQRARKRGEWHRRGAPGATDLTDRTDCAARKIRDSVVTVIVPTQNPDGRELDYRRNSYGFDLNRDWFARTQPETDGKLELLRKLPPRALHRRSRDGCRRLLLPAERRPRPSRDRRPVDPWINDLYGASMIDQFTAKASLTSTTTSTTCSTWGTAIRCPTTGFLRRRDDVREEQRRPGAGRVHEQYVALWTSISCPRQKQRTRSCKGWAGSYRQAYKQGVPASSSPTPCSRRAASSSSRYPTRRSAATSSALRAAKAAEVQDLVRRLQRMDVEVRVLTPPLRVPDYREVRRAHDGPSGCRQARTRSRWRRQKHWVQAMLGEDSYVPFPYFYDVTAWSGPLLLNNVAGGRSGVVLHPVKPAKPQARREVSRTRSRRPDVGVWVPIPTARLPTSPRVGCASLYDDKWKLPYTSITSDSIGWRIPR